MKVDELAFRFANFSDAETVASHINHLRLVQAPQLGEVGLEHRFQLHFHVNLFTIFLFLFVLANHRSPTISKNCMHRAIDTKIANSLIKWII